MNREAENKLRSVLGLEHKLGGFVRRKHFFFAALACSWTMETAKTSNQTRNGSARRWWLSTDMELSWLRPCARPGWFSRDTHDRDPLLGRPRTAR